MNKTSLLARLFAAFGLAALLTLFAVLGILAGVNNAMADRLYQRPAALSGEIVILGIDQRAVEALGPWPWPRTVLAETLDKLNGDVDTRPAVIGIDALFVGASDTVADAALAEAAARHDNVVTATAATFGTVPRSKEDGSFFMDDYAVLSYDEPYDALLRATKQGHINAMLDTDGILRHAIWQIDLPDGRSIPSFHQQVYRSYQDWCGQPADCTPPIDARHRWYLPLQAKPGDLGDDFSVVDLLNNELDPSLFAGKIVLIGPYAAGLQDSYYTAIDHATPMYGVEYQANAISALLAADTKTELARTPQLFLLFLLLFATLLFLRGRRLFSATLLWLLLSLGWLLGAVLLYRVGFVVQILYVPLFVSVCYVGSVAANYLRETLEKRRVTATFQRYVAPEIVSELLHGDPAALELGGKLCDIAVLFVDIRGFTAMSEGLPPQTVVEIINRYLTLTSRCIFQNDGTLDKYVGDCTMAFWGAPLPQEDPVFKAVKAALDMVDGAKALADELEQQYGRGVAFGVGVHYGPAVVGNIGSPTRMDYTAIGDTVNTAARLEANAPAGQIYVSRAVANQLKDRLCFTSLGDGIRLKGKAEGFEILRVETLLPDNLLPDNLLPDEKTAHLIRSASTKG